MIKSFGDKASVLLGSNKIYSSTSSYWGRVNSGAYFKFTKDSPYFNIAHSYKETYSKTFTVKNKNSIVINTNLNPVLMKNDQIKLSYQEFNLKQVKVLLSEGRNYKVNDLLFIEGGILNPFYQSTAILKVTNTDEVGAIKEVIILDKGKYINPPENNEVLNCSTDGTGQEAKVVCEFDLNEKVEFLERFISNVSYSQNETSITFLQPLPSGINSGNFSFEKWVISLTSSYDLRQFPVIEEEYEIYNDFLPESNLLKLIRGHTAPDVVINKNFELLLNRIKELEEKLKNLK